MGCTSSDLHLIDHELGKVEHVDEAMEAVGLVQHGRAQDAVLQKHAEGFMHGLLPRGELDCTDMVSVTIKKMKKKKLRGTLLVGRELLHARLGKQQEHVVSGLPHQPAGRRNARRSGRPLPLLRCFFRVAVGIAAARHSLPLLLARPRPLGRLLFHPDFRFLISQQVTNFRNRIFVDYKKLFLLI